VIEDHPVSARLALIGLCGDLVVAIEAMAIREIRRMAETPSRPVRDGVSMIELRDELLPGWDLGVLLGIDAEPSSWVIIDLPGDLADALLGGQARVERRVGLALGRCVTVQSLPICRAVPQRIFTSRRHAITAAFSTAGIPELEEHVSGVVLDLAHLFGDRELTGIAGLGKEGREAALEA
jgi:chemotaxis signal transduction protein